VCFILAVVLRRNGALLSVVRNGNGFVGVLVHGHWDRGEFFAHQVAKQSRLLRFAFSKLAGGLHFGEQFDEFLLALGLIVATFGVRQLSNVHGAEFGPAHGAELRFLVKIVG